MELSRIIQKLTAPLARRVKLMARRAVVQLVYDDPKMQELQLAIFAGEVHDQVERFEDYGLTSHPHPGAEALVLALGGDTGHSVVVKVGDRRYRVTGLAAGEVCLYDDQGQKIHLKRGKAIEISGCDTLDASVATKATIDCPDTETTGNLSVGGDLTVSGTASVTGALSSATSVADVTGTMQAMRDSYNGHTHPGDSGGTTGTPSVAMA